MSEERKYLRATEPDINALADAIRAHMAAAGMPAFYLTWDGSAVGLRAASLSAVNDATIQAAVTACAAPSELANVKRYVDQMPLAERANFLTILDAVNLIRSKLVPPLAAVTPAQYLAAVKAKAEALALLALALLALALTAAACGSAGVSTAKVQAPVEMVLGGTATYTLGQAYPVLNGQVIHPGSVECTGIAPVSYVPSPSRVTEIRAWTERALRWDLDHGVLVSPLGIAEAKRLLQYLPAIRFYDKPTYNYSRWPDGTWVWACAQGFAGFDGPKVAADDPARTERLTCYESVNFYVGLIGRLDLWDTTYIQTVENAVGSQLTGGWRVN